ncbi:hypothetical protein [Streptomyces caeruleatus]|uniref:Uncharacterized protein n=1 Tax=Streptomyces caeruleatus TaxID=661399 RepID=A0A117RK79_9ACTN|nr:hypothetical protein [Streptomyces caeruleatus]KUN95386.1 hypothetical protein AQJ67_35950 [Streptomyces caeruleatus]
MRLQPAQLQWNDRVMAEARKHRYTVFVPQRENQRGDDPSLILVRGPRVIMLWLRMGRRKPVPQVDRHREAGREAHAFWPADWPLFVRVLVMAPAPVGRLADRVQAQDGADGDDAA